MISLTCTSCKKVLEIDDAFAGGVCRCQFCGTIQTVPASLKKGAAAGASTKSKTLYQKITAPKPAAAAPQTAAPADGSAAAPADTSKAVRAAQPLSTPSPLDRKRLWIIGITLGAGAALLIGVIAWIAT